MANPRQRRKQKSGTAKVKQSRRQQDKLKKVIVTGPSALTAQWDVRKTARQNYELLGLAHKRPLALRQSGGTEKEIQATEYADDGADYSDSDSDVEENSDGAMNEDDKDGDDRQGGTEASSSSMRPPSNTTSKDIPKGFARIERDADGKILRVVMSAHDDPEGAAETVEGEEQEENDGETPWGEPLNQDEHPSLYAKEVASIPAKNAAVRDLELASQQEKLSKVPRFSSNGERDVLQNLVQKYGTDVAAMSRDIKLNRDQRTAGQLRKAIQRAGGVEKLRA